MTQDKAREVAEKLVVARWCHPEQPLAVQGAIDAVAQALLTARAEGLEEAAKWVEGGHESPMGNKTDLSKYYLAEGVRALKEQR